MKNNDSNRQSFKYQRILKNYIGGGSGLIRCGQKRMADKKYFVLLKGNADTDSVFTGRQPRRAALKAAGIECEYIWIGMDNIQGCIACYKCTKNKDKKRISDLA